MLQPLPEPELVRGAGARPVHLLALPVHGHTDGRERLSSRVEKLKFGAGAVHLLAQAYRSSEQSP